MGIELILCSGPQGSGKSTWARKFSQENPDLVYLSTDNIRKEITGNVSDQSANSLVYSLIRTKAENALLDGHSVLIDATFIRKSWRKDYVKLGKRLGAKLVAHVFTADRDTLISRVQQRSANGGLNVPVNIIDKYIADFEPPDYTEFDEIITHNS
jgi:predicted kinase